MINSTAIIVTYNSEAAVGAAVRSAKWAGLKVVVVDNASTDASTEVARAAGADEIIVNVENLGFAGGVNRGFAALGEEAQCVVLLNPDAEITTPVDALLESCWVHGGACGMLQDVEGKPQTGFQLRRFPHPLTLALEVLGINRAWPGNPVNRSYRYFDLDFGRSQIVEQPAAAFLVVRRDVWVALGGFDVQFHPVWFEDVDFCKRLKTKGFSIEYVPSAVARHVGGHSVGKLPYTKRLTTWYASLLKYGQKHFSSAGLRVTAAAVLFGAVPRCVLGICEERNVRPIAVWVTICNLCIRILFLGQGRFKEDERVHINRGF